MTFDVEDTLASIGELLKTSLNSKIQAVEAEKVAKGKGLTPPLETIAPEAFFFQTFNERILNMSPAVFYGVESMTPIDSTMPGGQNIEMFIEVWILDNGEPNVMNRVFRYTRAVKELIEKTFMVPLMNGKMRVEALRPIAIRPSIDSSEEFKVGGVTVTTSIY